MKTDRMYYTDSSRTEFEATVVEETRLHGRPAVALDRTCFYPTSGGQPFDTGTLGGARVSEVIEHGEAILHVLDGEGEPLSAGARVLGRIDWPRRFDHMQQHTGQHILSQSFHRTCAARTVSFHLGDESSTIDVSAPAWSAEEVSRAEAQANQVVLDDLEVRVHLVGADDIDRFVLRKATDREGEIRVVEIPSFDQSACGGTHCSRTGSVGPIKVCRWERRGADTRIEFVCGWRALRDYAWKHDLVRGLAEELSVRGRDLGVALARAIADARSLRREGAALRERLTEYEAADLLRAATEVRHHGVSVRIVRAAFADRSPDDLKRLAQVLTAGGGVVAILGLRAEKAYLVFAQSPGLPFDMAALLRANCAAVGGRGGGTRDLAQGGGPSVGGLEVALQQASDHLATPGLV